MDDAYYGQVAWAGPPVSVQPAGCALLPVHAPAALPSKTQNACGRGQGTELPNLQNSVQGEAFMYFVLSLTFLLPAAPRETQGACFEAQVIGLVQTPASFWWE